MADIHKIRPSSASRLWSVLPHVTRIIRFTLVGLVSTFIYVSTMLSCVRVAGWSPMAGHAAGLGISTACSYFGHLNVTFRAAGRHDVYLPRFLAQTAITTLLSTTFVALAKAWSVDYRWAMAANVTVVPVLNFLSMQIWVFRPKGRTGPPGPDNSPGPA